MIRSLSSQAARMCRSLPSNPLLAGRVAAARVVPPTPPSNAASAVWLRTLSSPPAAVDLGPHASAQEMMEIEKEVEVKATKVGGRKRKMADPIVVTERAAERINELLSGPGAPEGAIGIRLGVRRRGCNGLSYTLNYATERPAKDDEVVGPGGVRVFLEPMAVFSVVGTTMDFEDTELASEFTFSNPNSKGECGCGESFTV